MNFPPKGGAVGTTGVAGVMETGAEGVEAGVNLPPKGGATGVTVATGTGLCAAGTVGIIGVGIGGAGVAFPMKGWTIDVAGATNEDWIGSDGWIGVVGVDSLGVGMVG